MFRSSRVPASAILLSVLCHVGCKNTRNGGFSSDFDVDAVVNEDIVTVVELSWETEEDAVSWVEYGYGGDTSLVTPRSSESGRQHQVALYGLPPVTEVWFEAHSELDSGVIDSGGEITTGQLPAELGELYAETFLPSQVSPEPYLVGVMDGIQAVLFVMDRGGNYLWYRILEAELADEDSTVMQGVFALDSRDLLWVDFTIVSSKSDATLHRVDLLGNVVEEREITDGHHAFFEHEDGTVAYIAHDQRDWFDEEYGTDMPVAGDAILELQPSGEVVTVFSTWDWAEPTRHERWEYGADNAAAKWTHANSLRYDSDLRTYQLSIASLDTLIEIDRDSGEVLESWGSQSEHLVCAGCVEMNFQHTPLWTDDGTLLMTSITPDNYDIYAVEYELDEQSGELVDVWTHGRNDGISAPIGGQVLRLANGNTLVGMGSASVLQEVSPSGELVWEAYTSLGEAICEVQVFDDFYLRESR